MEICRNNSGQPIILTVGKGKVVHLLAGKSVALSEGELKSPQVQTLKSNGILKIVKRKGVANKTEITPVKAKVEMKEEKKAPAVKPAAKGKKEIDDKKSI